jgi:hypothetical protein
MPQHVTAQYTSTQAWTAGQTATRWCLLVSKRLLCCATLRGLSEALSQVDSKPGGAAHIHAPICCEAAQQSRLAHTPNHPPTFKMSRMPFCSHTAAERHARRHSHTLQRRLHQHTRFHVWYKAGQTTARRACLLFVQQLGCHAKAEAAQKAAPPHKVMPYGAI